MEEIRIKGESEPVRCEVCHQADCFDAKMNECSRCKGLEKLKIEQTIDLDYILKDYSNDSFHKLIGFIFIVAGLLFIVESFQYNLAISILGIISIFTGLKIPQYYSKKVDRLKWIIKNLEMEDVEITFRVKDSVSDGVIFYAEINKDTISPREIKLAFPSGDAKFLIDKTVCAKLCFDSHSNSHIVFVDKFVVFGEHW